jgi:hypothetical protein
MSRLIEGYKNFKQDIKLIFYWLIFLTFSQVEQQAKHYYLVPH